MATLREQIEFFPPGLIIIRGPKAAAAVIQEMPRDMIAELSARGYAFIVLPENLTLEAVSDDVIESVWRERVRRKIPVIKKSGDGLH